MTQRPAPVDWGPGQDGVVYTLNDLDHDSMMRFALELGRGDAMDLLARHHPPRRADHAGQQGVCAMALWGGRFVCSDHGMLAVMGQPLPSPALDVPRSLSEAVTRMTGWDGIFAAAYWNLREQRLLVLTDFLGMFPLYVQRHETGLCLATQTQAFRTAEPSAEGWAAFIALGFTLGDTTLCRGVQRVPAGRCLVYDNAGSLIEQRSTWQYPAQAAKADTDAIMAAARRCRDLYLECSSGRDSCLLLSGGFDSRFIACLLVEAGVQPLAMTVDNPGEAANTEGILARRTAEALDLRIHSHRAGPDFFSSTEYLDYLASTDAATPSLGLFIAQIAQFIAGQTPVWEGLLPGATLVNLHNPGGGFELWDRREGEGRDANVWRAADTLFVADFAAELRESFRAAWAREVARYEDSVHGVAEFVLRNRSRHRTAINPLQVFGVDRDVYLPGATREFVESAQSVPFEEKAEFGLYLRLFQQFPAVRRLPYLSGGKLVGSPGSTRQKAWLAQRMKLHEWFVRRPRIARLLKLPLPRAYFTPSRFSESGAFAELDDPWVRSDIDFSTVGPGVRKLAFHWAAWRYLHRGQLREGIGVE